MQDRIPPYPPLSSTSFYNDRQVSYGEPHIGYSTPTYYPNYTIPEHSVPYSVTDIQSSFPNQHEASYRSFGASQRSHPIFSSEIVTPHYVRRHRIEEPPSDWTYSHRWPPLNYSNQTPSRLRQTREEAVMRRVSKRYCTKKSYSLYISLHHFLCWQQDLV